MRVEDFYDDQLVFLDESAASEFTKDRKFDWSMVGYPAVKERDLRRSERWSILPAYANVNGNEGRPEERIELELVDL
jgi:hypothetical protein